MTSTYWNQWSSAELLSILGAPSRYQNDDQDDSHNDSEKEKEHCCSGCMYCLDVSWRDFL